jgi:putative ABC transport system ATP-binding protein
MTTTPILKIRDLVKIYDLDSVKVEAIRRVSFEVHKGEFVAVMGPSGSGKSTLMSMIGCLDQPTHGDIFIDEVRVSTMEEDELARIRNKKIGFVFQSFNLLPRLNSLENVELPLLYSGFPAYSRHKNSLKMLTEVGLRHRAYHLPAELSGGERQRVAIARALINKPSLILADEPTGNLDTKGGIEIMRIFQNLNQSGATIIMVTHDPEIARYSRRIIYFKDGHMISDESIEQNKL